MCETHFTLNIRSKELLWSFSVVYKVNICFFGCVYQVYIYCNKSYVCVVIQCGFFVSMLGRRRRRRTNIWSTLGQRLVFAESPLSQLFLRFIEIIPWHFHLFEAGIDGEITTSKWMKHIITLKNVILYTACTLFKIHSYLLDHVWSPLFFSWCCENQIQTPKASLIPISFIRSTILPLAVLVWPWEGGCADTVMARL